MRIPPATPLAGTTGGALLSFFGGKPQSLERIYTEGEWGKILDWLWRNNRTVFRSLATDINPDYDLITVPTLPSRIVSRGIPFENNLASRYFVKDAAKKLNIKGSKEKAAEGAVRKKGPEVRGTGKEQGRAIELGSLNTSKEASSI